MLPLRAALYSRGGEAAGPRHCPWVAGRLGVFPDRGPGPGAARRSAATGVHHLDACRKRAGRAWPVTECRPGYWGDHRDDHRYRLRLLHVGAVRHRRRVDPVGDEHAGGGEQPGSAGHQCRRAGRDTGRDEPDHAGRLLLLRAGMAGLGGAGWDPGLGSDGEHLGIGPKRCVPARHRRCALAPVESGRRLELGKPGREPDLRRVLGRVRDG